LQQQWRLQQQQEQQRMVMEISAWSLQATFLALLRQQLQQRRLAAAAMQQ
jgi:hypothetical protein